MSLHLIVAVSCKIISPRMKTHTKTIDGSIFQNEQSRCNETESDHWAGRENDTVVENTFAPLALPPLAPRDKCRPFCERRMQVQILEHHSRYSVLYAHATEDVSFLVALNVFSTSSLEVYQQITESLDSPDFCSLELKCGY